MEKGASFSPSSATIAELKRDPRYPLSASVAFNIIRENGSKESHQKFTAATEARTKCLEKLYEGFLKATNENGHFTSASQQQRHALNIHALECHRLSTVVADTVTLTDLASLTIDKL